MGTLQVCQAAPVPWQTLNTPTLGGFPAKEKGAARGAASSGTRGTVFGDCKAQSRVPRAEL